MKTLVTVLGLALLCGCVTTPTTPAPTAKLAAPPVPPPAAKSEAKSSPHVVNVTLAWDYGTNSTLAGFRIYQGVASRVYTNIVQSPGVLTRQATVTNLPVGSLYYFAATAYATNGLESDYSGEATYFAEGLPAPTNVIIKLTTMAAVTPKGPWSELANLSLTNPPMPTGYFRLAISRDNF